jgi:hypothetical protein
VAHNVGASHIVRQRSHLAPLTTLEDTALAAAAPSPEHAAGERQALDRLMAMVRRLKPPDRQVMLLWLEDVEAAAIAEVTACRRAPSPSAFIAPRPCWPAISREEARVTDDPKQLWQEQAKEGPRWDWNR